MAAFYSEQTNIMECCGPVSYTHLDVYKRQVLQNLKLGAYTRKDKKEIDDTLKMIYERFPRLEERKNQPAGTLSGGEQQMLAMGRALMSKPRICLLYTSRCV